MNADVEIVREAIYLPNVQKNGDLHVAEEVSKALARLEAVVEAARRNIKLNDYCFVCDCHPSGAGWADGHAKDCALRALDPEDQGEGRA